VADVGSVRAAIHRLLAIADMLLAAARSGPFQVPSCNLTTQQMVARQVDLGTYAGLSMILGSDKGGLIAVA
jgi:hypothetical protein